MPASGGPGSTWLYPVWLDWWSYRRLGEFCACLPRTSKIHGVARGEETGEWASEDQREEQKTAWIEGELDNATLVDPVKRSSTYIRQVYRPAGSLRALYGTVLQEADSHHQSSSTQQDILVKLTEKDDQTNLQS
ncbi:hypothetical protein RRG08_040001 [Elysia crispata]|uniref:Uncharacterized protein n=1 Tax=Elysia crispata TaxID=231223 RepID=A0AAE0Z804_9GAST|nr:hypothetical protein RRG08_040001 [Elysia crispata]